MADDDASSSNKQRLRYSQIIEASLLSIGNVATLEDDLDYSANVMKRAVTSLKTYERKVDFHHLQEHEKMKAMLTLNTIYSLQSKVLQSQEARERERQLAAAATGGGGGGMGGGASASPSRGGVSGTTHLTDNNFNPFFPNRKYGGAGGNGPNTSIDASRVSAASPGRSMNAGSSRF